MQAEKAMLEDLTATGKKFKLKGFEMIRAVHLDKEPWTYVDIVEIRLKLTNLFDTCR